MTKEEIDKAIKVMMFLRYKIWVVPDRKSVYSLLEPSEEEKQKAYEICLELLNKANETK